MARSGAKKGNRRRSTSSSSTALVAASNAAVPSIPGGQTLMRIVNGLEVSTVSAALPTTMRQGLIIGGYAAPSAGAGAVAGFFVGGIFGAIIGGVVAMVGGILYGASRAQVRWEDATLLQLVSALTPEQRTDVSRIVVQALFEQGVDVNGHVTTADVAPYEALAREIVLNYISQGMQQLQTPASSSSSVGKYRPRK